MAMKVGVHVTPNSVPAEAIKSQFGHWVEIFPEGDDAANLTLYMPPGIPFEKVQAIAAAINAAAGSVNVKLNEKEIAL